MAHSPAALVLCWHHLHPPQGGAALRNWQNVRALAERGPVDVLSVGAGQQGPPPAPVRAWQHFDPEVLPPEQGLRAALQRRSWWLRPCTHPWSEALWREPIVSAVRAQLARGDIGLVVLEELWFQRFLPLAHRQGSALVFDAHNVEGRLRGELALPDASLLARTRARRLTAQVRALERDLVARADQTWCCSELDAGQLASLRRPPRSLHVVPNTIDVEHYERVRADTVDAAHAAASPVIAFVGAYSYGPNETAARLLIEDVLPALRAARGDVRLLLVGRDPPPWMQAVAGARPEVIVTGAVADVRPYLAQASVIAVPLTHGSGTRLKLLEAFAAGRPVVSTAKGAEGLDARHGEELVLCEPAGFPAAILALLADPARAARLARNALAFVESRYSWPVARARIHAALDELARTRTGP